MIVVCSIGIILWMVILGRLCTPNSLEAVWQITFSLQIIVN